MRITETEAKALMTLAGFQVDKTWELANQYWPRTDHYYEEIVKGPGFLFDTPQGLIEISTRKRVIVIDWIGTSMRCNNCVLTEDQVTKGDHYVHAHSTAKAVEYLTTVKRFLDEDQGLMDG